MPVNGKRIAIGTVSLVKIAVSIHAERKPSLTVIFCSLLSRVTEQPANSRTVNEISKMFLDALVPIEPHQRNEYRFIERA